jgi:hypothetical protein
MQISDGLSEQNQRNRIEQEEEIMLVLLKTGSFYSPDPSFI